MLKVPFLIKIECRWARSSVRWVAYSNTHSLVAPCAEGTKERERGKQGIFSKDDDMSRRRRHRRRKGTYDVRKYSKEEEEVAPKKQMIHDNRVRTGREEFMS